MVPISERPEAAWPGLPPGRCARCLHRLEWCLCGEIPRLETRTRIVVVRQHSERFRSSNTGRLAHLALVNSALCDVGGPGRLPFDLPESRPQIWTGSPPDRSAPAFPAGTDRSIESLGAWGPGSEPDAWLLFPEGEARTRAPEPPPGAVIALDASWPAARRMRQRLPGLQGRRMLALAPVAAVARMRRSPQATHVSTIEAIAGVLRLLGEPAAADALDRLFEVAIERQRRSGRQPHVSPPPAPARGQP